MTREIGSGIKALEKFIDECESAGGIPQLRTGYGGTEFDNKLIVACYGKASQVPGGTITDIPKQLIDKCRETNGDYKYIKEWIREMGLSY